MSKKRFVDNQIHDTEEEARKRTPGYYINPSWSKIEWEEPEALHDDSDTI